MNKEDGKLIVKVALFGIVLEKQKKMPEKKRKQYTDLVRTASAVFY